MLLLCCRWWQRLDVAPFLVLYALWAAWALELLWKEGSQRWSMVQLITTGLVAVHVSTGLVCMKALSDSSRGLLRGATLSCALLHGCSAYVWQLIA